MGPCEETGNASRRRPYRIKDAEEAKEYAASMQVAPGTDILTGRPSPIPIGMESVLNHKGARDKAAGCSR